MAAEELLGAEKALIKLLECGCAAQAEMRKQLLVKRRERSQAASF